MEESIKCGFWNILADGLSQGEFMTNGGDMICTDWARRKYRILSVLESMLQVCDIVVTVENDHFYWLLNELNIELENKIRGVYYIESDLNEYSTTRKFRKTDPTHTFMDDCGVYVMDRWKRHLQHPLSEEFGKDYASIYRFNDRDPYTSDDGIGIYYRKDKLQFISADKPKINTSEVYICNGNEQYVIAKFETILCRTEVNICGAHLSSGEDESKEDNRVTKLEEMFGKMEELPNVIIMMDSNCSDLYEENYQGKTCSQVIFENDYQNLICNKGSECFKMRHAHGGPTGIPPREDAYHILSAGPTGIPPREDAYHILSAGQPTKYGKLIFDAIDKIMIKDNQMLRASSPVAVPCRGQQINEAFGFSRCPEHLYPVILEWRIDEKKRNVLFQYSANVDNFRKCSDYLPQKVHDKSGNMLFEMDGNKKNRWGENMGQNEITGLAQMLDFHGIKEMDEMNLDQQVLEILKYLYPNENAPSDHPPIMAIIYL